MKYLNIGKIGLILTFVFVGFFWACSGPNTNEVEIVSISPSTDKMVKAGEKVDISVTVKYKLKEDTGRIALVVQKPGKGLPIAHSYEMIKKGAGKITLKVNVLVPLESPITVYTPMTPEGQKETRIVDSRIFKVNSALNAEEMKKAKFALTKNEIKIVSILPSLGKSFKVGEKVDIRVTGEYLLKEDNGSVDLIIQKADNGRVGIVVEPIKKGSGKITLKKSFIVPETGAIRVFMSVWPKGKAKTSIVDSRTFEVK